MQGANFGTITQLPIFYQNTIQVKATLLYGRNGSGKSTIAKAFKKIKGEDVTSIQAASLLDNYNNSKNTDVNDQAHIYIFDEDFVGKNVRIQEDGLGAIVMFGEQANLTAVIEQATRELEDAEADRNQKKSVAEEYDDVTSNKSPKYYIEKMKTVLRGDNSWADRDKKIKGNVVNSSVSDNTYKDFINLSPTKIRDELIVDFSRELDNLKSAQSGAGKIINLIPSIPDCYFSYLTETGNNLLKKVIEHPELSTREKYLLGLVQVGKGENLRATAQEFEDPALDHCPKCHQPLSEKYKAELIASIQKVLSEEVEDHQKQLNELLLPTLEIDLSAFSELDYYQHCVNSINTLNQIIQHNNKLIQTKQINPYTPINVELYSINETVESLLTLLQQLDNERNAYNSAVADTNSIKVKLTKINNEIAYYDVIDYYRQYEAKKTEKETAGNDFATAERIVIEKQTLLGELNAKRNNINIAIDVINDGLKYIFFSENRMQIQIEDGLYKILSNGLPVKPKDISLGERNIIGLCYFFTDILRGKNKDSAYAEEYLLVIDDPVSSYDFENKVGILSFLKNQLGKFLLGNNETRALVMTHDLFAALAIEKMMKEITAECKNKFDEQRNYIYAFFELNDCQLKKFINNRNEYTELMKQVYEYGKNGAPEQDAYIGNIMRQVLEAFSTFEFKKGIEYISTDDNILSLIEQENDRVHYKNLMYRIVLNEGSHRREQTQNMQVDYFAVISEPEKRRTAKEILCFMYLLNKPHMKAHLGEGICSDIEAWCDSVRNQS